MENTTDKKDDLVIALKPSQIVMLVIGLVVLYMIIRSVMKSNNSVEA